MNARKLCLSLALLLALAASLAAITAAQEAQPQAPLGTSFTYQGRLTDPSGHPIDNTCNFQFSLWDDPDAGTQAGPLLNPTGVAVTGGLFTVQLDFGDIFDGTALWLKIAVRCAGDPGYTDLSPRQPLTAAPYALYALHAPSGPTGPTGVTGATGPEGPAGPAGPSGATGPEGPIGPTGPQGLQGPAGEAGPTGPEGPVGPAGVTGPVGPPGATGPEGPVGSTGPQGLQGPAGDVGPSGPEGPVGPAGATGPLGPQGPAGVTGATGPEGAVGPTGPVGASGETGPEGPVGPTGPAGETGPTGPTGPVNPNADTLDGLDSTDFWQTAGNAGTIPGVHFLGTTDPISLTLAVSGTAALRLYPNATSPNLIGGYNGNWVAAGIPGATIGGGGVADDGFGNPSPNRVTSALGTVAGGAGNEAGLLATVGGGWGNTAGHGNATVGGGGYNTASGQFSTIAGGQVNTASGQYSTIAGGDFNSAQSTFTTIGGGYGNTASGEYATVGGGGWNNVSHDWATVGGGEWNVASQDWATVSGGHSNSANGWVATVGGGSNNTASGDGTVVGGGGQNQASGLDATVGGGGFNLAIDNYGVVGGGENNQAGSDDANPASAEHAVVGGGLNNVASGHRATVAGGDTNTASGWYAAIAGGFHNIAGDGYAAVCGGTTNIASGNSASIGGGQNNAASGWWGTIGGGNTNRAVDNYCAVGGGKNNVAGSDDGNPASGEYATVGGGQGNTAQGPGTTVGGGIGNTASDAAGWATVGGGYHNQAISGNATVAGGNQNTASGGDSAIGGGEVNSAYGMYATISGGQSNNADNWGAVGGGQSNLAGGYASVGGGLSNAASYGWSTVPGGRDNVAGADYAFAAGRQAKANHQGAFVWADSIGVDFASTAANQFAVRATGGANFTTGAAAFQINGQTAWHAGNDGSGSGLDADLLDGQHGSAFALSDHSHYSLNAADGSPTDAVYVDNSGFVGIRTVVPAFPLEVVGNAKVTASSYNTVFATSSSYQGNLGGLAGADAKCQERAAAAGLTGIYKAWLSDSTTDARDRLTHGSRPYKLVDGTTIANNWADLTDASLLAPINKTESGGTPAMWTWSSTLTDGSKAGGAYCNDWTTTDPSHLYGAFGVGRTDSSGEAWTHTPSGGWYCENYQVLYCFEQEQGSLFVDGSLGVGTTSPARQLHTLGGARLETNGRWMEVYDDGTNLITTTTGAHLTLGGVWTNASDRNLKENLAPVDGEEVLARLAEVPVTTWNYRAENPSVRHMGPTAQDFYAAFGLGNSDRSIGTVDADGVALAAIQGLYAENQALKAQVTDLEARLTALEQAHPGRKVSLSGYLPWLLCGGLVVLGGVAVIQRKRGQP